ncbi:hypothetical protein JCM14036_16830 [Desulfotomaculum defluvii]
MAKYAEGLGNEIVNAVNNGEISEPLDYKKVESFFKKKGYSVPENYIRVILSNSTENNHSPTYTKYFIRVSKGKYILHPDYRKKLNYYWLNNSENYEWSFSGVNVVRKQTYSNLNEDGDKRKNQSCFQNINIGDKVLAYETGEIKAITAICVVIGKYEENDEILVEFQILKRFEKFLTLDKMKTNQKLSDCSVVGLHRGTLFDIRKKHFKEIAQMLDTINTSKDYYELLEKEVQESRKLTNEERKKRLESRESNIPDRIERVSNDFKRNPDVIVEVLERANGICEECRKPAPFNRASDGTPYLEVHHIIRLADGGEDTVDNAIAVCPNCHRKLHFG